MKDNERIIQSLLDLDFYKLTMAQVVWRHFPDIPVKYRFKNRTCDVNLKDFIRLEELQNEIEHIRGLGFTKEEIDYLRECPYLKGLFCKEFLDFLYHLQLPEIDIKVDDNFGIEIVGSWSETILWETLILSVVNELYYRSLMKQRGDPLTLSTSWQEGERRLMRKIDILKKNPEIKFVEFGTRRRFSRRWQKFVLGKLAEKLSFQQLLGTSNILLAKKFNLPPVGTFAHEMFMILAGIYHESDEEIRASHNKVLEIWWQEYGESLSIALTDTYGSDFFFRNFTCEQARNWKGLRQDSGDPIQFGEKAIKFYQEKGIDPKSKLILFSDGLDIEKILKLTNHFAHRIKVAFGWGTNLTNDCGYKALSLVVKPVEACGHPVVKLSDNIAKAIGDPREIERFKRIFGYRTDYNQPCIY